MHRLRRHDWQQPGEPYASLYTPEWMNGLFLIGAMPEPERGQYAAFFAHLDAGWRALRPVQLAAESLLHGHSPRDDVADWINSEMTDNFRWLANACLQMIPTLHVLPEERNQCPFGPEPPVDELEPESQMLGRNARLLAMMEGAAGFPHALRGLVGPAASALTAWEREMPAVSGPVLAYVVSRTQ